MEAGLFIQKVEGVSPKNAKHPAVFHGKHIILRTTSFGFLKRNKSEVWFQFGNNIAQVFQSVDGNLIAGDETMLSFVNRNCPTFHVPYFDETTSVDCLEGIMKAPSMRTAPENIGIVILRGTL